MNTINELMTAAHQNSVAKGFHEGETNLGLMIALIHSEVSEALEGVRSDKFAKNNLATLPAYWLKGMADENFGHSLHDPEVFKMEFETHVKDTFEDELADVVIRVFDLCGLKGIDLESHILAKMRYNAMRPHKHGKKF